MTWTDATTSNTSFDSKNASRFFEVLPVADGSGGVDFVPHEITSARPFVVVSAPDAISLSNGLNNPID